MKKWNNVETAFVSLVKLQIASGIQNTYVPSLSEQEWRKLLLLSQRQGLTSIVLDSIGKLPKDEMPPQEVLYEWIVQSWARKKKLRKRYCTSTRFANALSKENVKCLVLKGFAVASYYPETSYREFGDLDCFLIKQKSENDELQVAFEEGNEIARKMGARVRKAGYKHSHIRLDELLIENHQYLTNFNETKQGTKIENILRQLALGGGEKRIGDTNLWIPSPGFNAIFMLKHSLGDFIPNDMALRAIFDWAAFMKAEQENIDWPKMFGLLNECKLRNFFDVLTEACMIYLGLEIRAKGLSVRSHRRLADDMMHDVVNKPAIGSGRLTFWQKFPNIWKRFKRQFKYRTIETENVGTLIWNTIAFCSFMHRKVSLE